VTTVPISPGSSGEEGLWRTALEVAALFRDWPWVIIRAQMVMLLELEHGRPSGRTTSDLDAMVDVRVVVDAMRLGAERLIDAGFESSAEHRFRFVRGLDQVDLLVPDHVGRRVDLATISSEATAGIPGGRRALATRRFIPVDIVHVGVGDLPVPSLAGAIVIKMSAHEARGTRRDLEDLVRLLALVDDVDAVRDELKPRERKRLGAISALVTAADAAWSVAVDPDNARAAFARLAD